MNITAIYKNKKQDEVQDCVGILSRSTCTLRPALIEYSMMLINDIITLNISSSWRIYHSIKMLPLKEHYMSTQRPTTNGVTYLYLNSLFKSSSHLSFAEAVGRETTSTCNTALWHIQTAASGCYNSFSDPTLDVMTAMREIFFWLALFTAVNNDSNTFQR